MLSDLKWPAITLAMLLAMATIGWTVLPITLALAGVWKMFSR